MQKILLFDLGGVLVELEDYPLRDEQAFNHMSSDDFWQMWLKSPAARAFDKGEISPQHFAAQLIEELALNIKLEAFIEEFSCWPKGLFPGVAKLFERIKPQYTKAILSNTNELHWPDKLRDMGVHDLSQHNFISYQIGLVKPDSECYQYVLQKLSCVAQDIIFFDDNIINVEAARSLGMQAFVTRGLPELEQQLENLGVLHIE